MKNNLFINLLLLALVVVVVSCSKDHDLKKIPFIDDKAGTFSLTNLSYDEGVGELSVNALKGDTLKLLFTPKNEYKEYKFTLECEEGLDRFNDSLFVVNVNSSGNHQYLVYAKYEDATETTTTSLSGSAILTVNIPNEYVIIPYKIELSDDLAELVSPVINYTDTYSHNHQLAINHADLIQTDSTLVEVYVDEKGKRYYVSDDIVPENNWVKESEFKTSMPDYYSFSVRYYRIGIKANVTVNYIPKDNITLSRDRYKLSHRLIRGSADVHVPNIIYMENSIDLRITINIGGKDGIEKDEVEAALKELSNTPDVMNLDIFRNFGIEEIK